MNIPTHSESFKIRSSESRPDGKAQLRTLCDLLQEIAGNHALKLDFDVTQLQQENKTWFLQRLDLQIVHYPEWRETVTVKTWPSGNDRLHAYRDFLIEDEEGKVIARALSYWLMVNLKSRRPTRLPEEIQKIAPEKGEKHVLPIKDSALLSPKNPQYKRNFAVRRSDLDVNGHVNNISYVEWITETIPEKLHLSRLDIEFKAESSYGDEVIIEAEEPQEGKIRAQISHKKDGQILALSELSYRK